MTKKTFQLVTGMVGGVTAIAIAVVSYIQPSSMAAINSAISIAGTAIVEICSQFVKAE